MKTRLSMISVLACFGVGLVCWHIGSATPAAADETSAMSAVTAAIPALGGEAKYVASKKCKACHKKEFESWESQKKAKTFELLLPGQATESKEKHGLDPNKDYSTDAGCLKCHSTGFGMEGGYAVPDAADEKAVKKAKKQANVGCECCHGPGGEYTKLHKEIKKSKRNYKHAEMLAAGVWEIEEARCTTCHNDQSPTYDAVNNPFNFEEMKKSGGHEIFPLKQRED
ncbi:MAG: cytochrome c family protein [Phycisphaerales bacterium]|nr:MAG: cytochrome c family protein [Phycisphaerales bacterium]